MKTKLAGVLTVLLSAALLTGCTTKQAPEYVPVPKNVVYGAGLKQNKAVQTKQANLQAVYRQVLTAVGTFDTDEHKKLFEYDNVTSTTFNLAANSPYFINKQRATVTCKPGKALGADIGSGFYVIGETFLLPTSGHTLAADKTAAQVKAAVKAVGAQNLTESDKDGVYTYKFALKNKQGITVRVYDRGSNVSGIRIGLDLPATTCYDLNTLPLTTAQSVKSWQSQVNALQ